MPTNDIIGLFAVLAVIVPIVFAIAWYIEKRRRAMWKAVALRYGFTYQHNDPYEIPDRYQGFALFQRGHSRRASNCLEGRFSNTGVLLFDYRYTTGSGKNRTTHHLSALIAQVGISCPHLVIRPEGFFDKIGEFLGFNDIDFEFGEFNRKFHVKSQDKRFAYDICHSGMMEFLLQHPKLTWELSGSSLLLYGLGRFDELEVDYSLNAAKDFLDRIPQHVQRGSGT